jgi:hypothetical protein
MPWSVATRDDPSRIKSGWLCDSCMRLLTVMYKLQVLHYRSRIYREREGCLVSEWSECWVLSVDCWSWWESRLC